MPSSSAARVACSASSTRCFFSFISVSVAAPTLTTATPPDSLASRSCSFSRSKSESVFSISALIWLMRPLIASVVAGAVDDRRVVLGDDDAAGAAELRELGVLELEAHLLGDHLAAGEDRDVLEHPLAAVAEARGLDGDAGERAAELVDDERRERLALDVLGDDQQRLARLDHLLEHRQQVADRADLLVGDQDVGVLEDGLHAVLVGDHVGRDVALVELHALGELEVHAERLALLDVDHAVLADLLDRVGDHVADLVVAGRDRRHAGDLVLARTPWTAIAMLLDDLVDGLLDAALERQRVGAGGDVLQALADDRLGEHGRGRRAVAGHVVGRRGDLAHELGALVLEDVLDLDLTSDRDAVVGDRRRAELLVEHDVAALRAERYLDRVGDRVNAARALRGLASYFSSLCAIYCVLLYASTFAQHVGLATGEQLLAVDLDLGAAVLAVEHLVAFLATSSGLRLPSSLTLPSPAASTLPFWGFSLAVSGRTTPLAVVLPSSSIDPHDQTIA